jgi:hypothetical protein
MILTHFEPTGARRPIDLQNVFAGQTAMLIGGAPSLKEQPLELLSKRGVLTMAMNNAALHFQPTLWVSGDRPECYDPTILLDPRIMKFAPLAHAQVTVEGRRYWQIPNVHFYMPQDSIPWDEYLGMRNTVPWYNNTLFVGINILYHMGIRRIILGGSDFGFSASGDMYAHNTELGSLEKKWNLDLYNSLVRELRMLRPVFEAAGLQLMDCSKNSRISQTYQHISLEQAVELCLTGFPKKPVNPASLPHCSKFAPESIQQKIAQWPGHQVLASPAQNFGDAGMKQIL